MSKAGELDEIQELQAFQKHFRVKSGEQRTNSEGP